MRASTVEEPVPRRRGGRETSTPVAVLGTLAEFHREPIPYDLSALVRLVSERRPDLLCLDITPDRWRRGDFADLPPEYREALLPLAQGTDIVVVPVAGESPPPEPAATGWRGRAIGFLRRCIERMQRGAPGPEEISEGPRHFTADLLYSASARLAGGGARRAWRAYTADLIDRVCETTRRDPGARVLVAVNVRHCHHVRRELRRRPGIEVVAIRDL